MKFILKTNHETS